MDIRVQYTRVAQNRISNRVAYLINSTVQCSTELPFCRFFRNARRCSRAIRVKWESWWSTRLPSSNSASSTTRRRYCTRIHSPVRTEPIQSNSSSKFDSPSAALLAGPVLLVSAYSTEFSSHTRAYVCFDCSSSAMPTARCTARSTSTARWPSSRTCPLRCRCSCSPPSSRSCPSSASSTSSAPTSMYVLYSALHFETLPCTVLGLQ